MVDPICFLVMCDAMGKPPTAPKHPSCISSETLDSILPGLESASENLKALGLNDDDTDGIPDFCENDSQ